MQKNNLAGARTKQASKQTNRQENRAIRAKAAQCHSKADTRPQTTKRLEGGNDPSDQARIPYQRKEGIRPTPAQDRQQQQQAWPCPALPSPSPSPQQIVEQRQWEVDGSGEGVGEDGWANERGEELMSARWFFEEATGEEATGDEEKGGGLEGSVGQCARNI